MTQNKTILFFPLNSPGHINSSLGVADRLKRETGHRVVFLVLGDMIDNSIEKHGHELVILNEVSIYEDYEISDDETGEVHEELMKAKGKTRKKFLGAHKWPQMIYRHNYLNQLDPIDAFIKSTPVFEKIMVNELISNHENYSKAIASIKPDLIIIDAYYIPPCVVNSGIPWARLYSANPLMLIESKLPKGCKPPPMIGCVLMTKQERLEMQNNDPNKWQAILDSWNEASQKIAKAIDQAGSTLNDFITGHGCSRLESGKQAHDSPYLNIYMYPEALDYDQDDDLFQYPARWVRCDSLVRQSNGGSAEQRAIDLWKIKIDQMSQNKKQIVFFSLGSIASGNVQLMKRYVSILAQDQERLYLVSKGVNGDKFDLNTDNMLGDKYIPQCYFLQRSDLAIIHGGNNSVTECFYYGVPTIVLPSFADQLDNAQRVEDLKLGKHLNLTRCTKDQLLGAINDILHNGALRNRVSDIGVKMRARDDIGKVLTLLEKLVCENHLDQELITK